MDIGSAAGRAHGIAAEQIANLNNYRSDFNFSDLERLVLEYADGMTRTPVDVSDALFTRLREKFTEAELVELSSAIAWESYRARKRGGRVPKRQRSQHKNRDGLFGIPMNSQLAA
jgi:alkylhydroperoxidase family enzyme